MDGPNPFDKEAGQAKDNVLPIAKGNSPTGGKSGAA
jgi:hypothetical protein